MQTQTTMTRIVLDSMLQHRDLPQHLKTQAAAHGLDHGSAVEMAQEYVKEVVEASMADSLLPDFAQQIICHALTSQIDWRYIGERMLVSPIDN